ncbi:TIR domain-containing protein [uncultured Trichococcus sp.]|uniref:toll/interleukin-1 receptor domain-containing protein n=1 Tax=uncultured Trichococcus sp. TaxID=189665 RepID=UPI002A18C859|nr:TIR domain-containing protein [uncultured Trichococcus sp.]
MSQHKKDLLKYEKEITKLTDEISKNNVHIQRYKEGLNKEQKKQFETMVKTMKVQGTSNEEYLKSHSELSKQLNELSFDIKDATKQKEIIEYDVFLSHSNLDKEEFVSELSDKLEGREIKVFEDVKVFKMGQSQTDMMNMGILNSRFVVIFLSPNFIKSGWSDYEFKSFLNREINEKRIIILPIWHNVSYDDVRDYNPFLVDKFALDTKKYTLDEIVESIYQVVVDSKNGI